MAKPEKIDEETGSTIQELQILEQNLQAVLMQKQAFQIENEDTESALEEIKKPETTETYKILGQIIIKADKKEIEKELSNKRDILKLRLSNLEKQEQALREKSEKLRSEILKKLKHSHYINGNKFS